MANSLQQSTIYLPNFPPSKTSKPCYSRFLQSAPLVALADVTALPKKPQQFQSSPSHRARVQVGNTNRWRIPAELGSDLLGTSQAMRAVESSKGKRKTISTGDIVTRLSPNESWYRNRGNNSTRMRNGTRSAPPPSKIDGNRYKTNLGLRYRATTAGDFKGERGTNCLLDEPPSLSKQVDQMQQSHYYIRPEKRQPTPIEVFLRSVHLASKYNGVDLIVNALNTNWSLHLSHAQESRLLVRLIKENIENDDNSERVVQVHFNDFQFEQDFISSTSEHQGVTVSIPRVPWYPKVVPVVVDLDVKDELITRYAFANGLCFLYENESYVDYLDVVSTLAVAHFLQMDALKERCANVMINNIDVTNACVFHSAALKYDLSAVREHCEKWLEMNLVLELSSSQYLSHLSSGLLEKLLKSQSLFSPNEYAIFRLLCGWVFLKEHNTMQILPNWETVVTSFMSCRDETAFLESDEGKKFQFLFKLVRLNGITKSIHLDEIIKMNIFPSQWLLNVFSHHYFSLQGGGDMSLLMRFDECAVRFGFVLKEPDTCYSDLLSLHGFHFDVHAEVDDSNTCLIFMERLRPTDPVFTQRISDRQSLSIRQDREVRYAIRAQYFDGRSFRIEQLGPKNHGFGVNYDAGKSEVLKITSPVFPMYVTFSLLFPPS